MTTGLCGFAGLGVGTASAQAPAPTKVYEVPSNSMAPTIQVGQNILTSLYVDHERIRPAVGALVVVHPPRSVDWNSERRVCGVPQAIPRGLPCPRSRGGRSQELFVKRVVAGPGDTVAVLDGRVVRNGATADEPYVNPACSDRTDRFGPCNLPHQITLPRNRYYLMGDNRGEAYDSRFWGPIPRAWFVAEVTQIGVPDPGLFR